MEVNAYASTPAAISWLIYLVRVLTIDLMQRLFHRFFNSNQMVVVQHLELQEMVTLETQGVFILQSPEEPQVVLTLLFSKMTDSVRFHSMVLMGLI